MFRTSAVRAPPMQVHPSNADYKKTCARSAAEGPLGLVAMDCFAPQGGIKTNSRRHGRGDAPRWLQVRSDGLLCPLGGRKDNKADGPATRVLGWGGLSAHRVCEVTVRAR